jgi:hypothetical protein
VAFLPQLEQVEPHRHPNFSRIDNAKLAITGPSGGNSLHRVYAVNYNILRIKQGMGGVAFGN